MSSFRLVLIAALVATTGAAHAAPTSVDLRKWLYPVEDQLSRGSCTIFAALSAMEAIAGVPRLSKAYAYSILKHSDLSPEGATPQQVQRFLQNNRMLIDRKMPYEQMVGAHGFGETLSEQALARAFNRSRGRDAERLRGQAMFQAMDVRVSSRPDITLAGLRETLAGNQVIVAFFHVDPEHWKLLKGRGLVIDDAPLLLRGEGGRQESFRPDATARAGHAVVLVGYTERGNFIVRNSWGLGWGDQGYIEMTPSYLLGHIYATLTVGWVDVLKVLSPHPQPEAFVVRAHGWREGGGTYAVGLSVVLEEPWVPRTVITGVTYQITDPDTGALLGALSSAVERFGWYVQLHNLPTRALIVDVTIDHADGMQSTRQFPIANVITFSSTPLID